MIDLETVHKMWEEDSQIKENDLDITSIESSKLYAKYLKLFNIGRLTLKKRELELSELKQDKWRYFAGKMTKAEMDDKDWDYDPFKGSTKPMKSELNHYIESDKDIQHVQLKIEYSKIVANALEEILNNLRWRHTVIRNIIDWKKFTSGM
jgi:hypothetical protein